MDMSKMGTHLMDRGKTVMMPTKEFVKEHKKLVKVLDKCGTPACKKESMKQRMDMAVAKPMAKAKPEMKMSMKERMAKLRAMRGKC